MFAEEVKSSMKYFYENNVMRRIMKMMKCSRMFCHRADMTRRTYGSLHISSLKVAVFTSSTLHSLLSSSLIDRTDVLYSDSELPSENCPTERIFFGQKGELLVELEPD